MPKGTVHGLHPSFNASLLEASPERAVAAFVECGDLSVDAVGRIWRNRRKVGGNHPRHVNIEPVRAENIIPSGRHQVQVYILSKRVVCLASRLVWFLAHGEIPRKHHVHHKNKNVLDNRLENLECVEGKSHISTHGTGRPAHNRGTAYGKTEAYQKSHAARMEHHAEICEKTYVLWRTGITQRQVAEILGISHRQVWSRVRYYRANSTN